jgi:hypothetical protein
MSTASRSRRNAPITRPAFALRTSTGISPDAAIRTFALPSASSPLLRLARTLHLTDACGGPTRVAICSALICAAGLACRRRPSRLSARLALARGGAA